MAIRLYGWLLRLYPATYRSTFRREMIAVFQQRRADAWQRGTPSGVVFCVREFASVIIGAWGELVRRSEVGELAGSAAGVAFDFVPTFSSFDDYFPRRSALIQGGILSLAAFSMVSFASDYGRGNHTFRLSNRGSRATDQPEFIESSESGFVAFGRSLFESADGVLVMELGRQATTATSELKRDSDRWKGAWSNLLWLLRVRPHFPRRSGAVFLVAPSALRAGKSEHTPQDIITTLMSQFDKSDVIALGELHWTQQDSDLRIKLIRHPDFPGKVRYVVVEFGNSLYQDVLDRYIGGEEVPKEELQKVWRDVTTPGGFDSPVYELFLNEVRLVNRGLPHALKVRVLAGDPPIDWAKIKGPEDWRRITAGRDTFPARLIAQEILRKDHKALVIYGAGHIWRKSRLTRAGVAIPMPPNLTSLIDNDFPARLYTVVRIGGVYPETAKLEQLIQGAERPMLLPLKGTAFAALDANEFLGRDIPVRLFADGLGMGEVADACIYSGKTADAIVEPDPSIDTDRAYAAEKERRMGLTPRPKM